MQRHYFITHAHTISIDSSFGFVYPYILFQCLYLLFDAVLIKQNLALLKIQFTTPYWLLLTTNNIQYLHPFLQLGKERLRLQIKYENYFMWIIPSKSIPLITSVGKNTLIIFLLHGFIVKSLEHIEQKDSFYDKIVMSTRIGKRSIQHKITDGVYGERDWKNCRVLQASKIA